MPINARDGLPDVVRALWGEGAAGILPSQEIAALIQQGHIHAPEPIAEAQLQPASLDLRLGPAAYEVRASFLPSENSTVLSRVDALLTRTIDLSQPAVLEKGRVYIVPVLEELRLPPNILGKANPKSTIGRLDVLTRLITDYGTEFERVRQGYSGKLYVEVAPRSFSIVVHAGTRLNQLRLMQGNPAWPDSDLTDLHRQETLVYSDGVPGDAVIAGGLWVSVDLIGSDESNIVGYRARPNAPPVDLESVGHYDPAVFWEVIERPDDQQLILQPGEFYILASKEKIRVPTKFAAEMVGYDPSVGEFRIHYAGFFDPGFGYGTAELLGSRAVLEVRSHEVPFLLRHGQRVGRLLYEPLTEPPAKVYGAAIGSSYQGQELALAKQFLRWR